MELVDALALSGGVAGRAALLGLGVPRHGIQSATGNSDVWRPCRGLYALTRADPLAVASAMDNAEPTCVSYLSRLGLPAPPDRQRWHLLVPSNRSTGGGHRKPSARVRLHFGVPIRGPYGPLLTAIDLASRCVSPEYQLAVIDRALNTGLVDVTDLGLLTQTRIGRKRWLITHCDRRAQSHLETLARVSLQACGLEVESQVQLPDVGRVDLLVEGRVIVELDGRSYHSDERAFSDDRRRDRAAVLSGYRVLRFTYDDVMHGMDRLVLEVQQATALSK